MLTETQPQTAVLFMGFVHGISICRLSYVMIYSFSYSLEFQTRVCRV